MYIHIYKINLWNNILNIFFLIFIISFYHYYYNFLNFKELHYFKNYSSLTECELIILRKTAFTNLRNQFRALNEQQRNVGSTNALNNTSNNNPSSPSTNDNANAASTNRLSVNQVTATGSFSTLNHHSHNTVPGKDLRESVIKTLETINRGRSTKKWKIFTKKDKKKEGNNHNINKNKKKKFFFFFFFFCINFFY